MFWSGTIVSYACYLTEGKIFSDWDRMIERKRGVSSQLDLWIERFLAQGETTDKLFNLFAKWLKIHLSIPALILFSNAINYVGKRTDLSLLSLEGIKPSEVAEEIIAETYFIVSRRSLL